METAHCFMTHIWNISGFGVRSKIRQLPIKMWLKKVGERDVRWLLDIRVCLDDRTRKANIYGIDRISVVGSSHL